MPIRYDINSELRLVYAESVGAVDLADLRRHTDQLAADPRYRSPMKKLVDYRAGRVIQMDSDQTRTLTRYKLEFAEKFTGEQCAFVVADDLDFGMSRLHGAHVERLVDTNVFRDLESALAWLGVDAEAFREWALDLSIEDAGPQD